VLELKSLSKIYPGSSVEAVKSIDLTVREGEFFSLLGPSGCGKTTLLRMLAGFEKPTQGEIHYGGSRIDLLPPHHRQFNLVFQRYALFPHLNVWENVAFGLRMKKIPKAEIEERVAEILNLVQMIGLRERGISTLSGGQQQRVALARALVNRPKILLLDEPLSALDLKLRQQMQVELLALQRRLKLGFIYVTHDQEEALTLSDRIAVMNQGVIEQIGTPQEVYEYPKTPFVAQFIGSVNGFEGKLLESPPGEARVMGTLRRNWVVKPSRDGMRPLPEVRPGDNVRILVRPEKVKLLKSAPASDQNSIEGTLKEILYQGAVTLFQVQPRETDSLLFTASQPNTAVTSKRNFQLGDRVYLAWSPEDCVLIGDPGV
jgi:spermidine/putrescine transport system ATP-binding protein